MLTRLSRATALQAERWPAYRVMLDTVVLKDLLGKKW